MAERRRARLHNLKAVDLKLPLGALTCVTGVSGSGKSTLVREVLFESAKACLSRREGALQGCDALEGWESLQRVLEVDPNPDRQDAPFLSGYLHRHLGRDPPALLHDPGGTHQGYGPGRFSFNLAGGRCDYCDGQG